MTGARVDAQACCSPYCAVEGADPCPERLTETVLHRCLRTRGRAVRRGVPANEGSTSDGGETGLGKSTRGEGPTATTGTVDTGQGLTTGSSADGTTGAAPSVELPLSSELELPEETPARRKEPQQEHVSTSLAKTRARSLAQAMRRWSGVERLV